MMNNIRELGVVTYNKYADGSVEIVDSGCYHDYFDPFKDEIIPHVKPVRKREEVLNLVLWCIEMRENKFSDMRRVLLNFLQNKKFLVLQDEIDLEKLIYCIDLAVYKSDFQSSEDKGNLNNLRTLLKNKIDVQFLDRSKWTELEGGYKDVLQDKQGCSRDASAYSNIDAYKCALRMSRGYWEQKKKITSSFFCFFLSAFSGSSFSRTLLLRCEK